MGGARMTAQEIQAAIIAAGLNEYSSIEIQRVWSGKWLTEPAEIEGVIARARSEMERARAKNLARLAAGGFQGVRTHDHEPDENESTVAY